MNKNKIILTLTVLLVVTLTAQALAWSFVSIADLANKDRLGKQQKDKVNKILDSIQNKNPDFVLVPGDMIMGRFWALPWLSVEDGTDKFYTRWKKRFEKRNLKYYTAVGDHELGDLPYIEDMFLTGLVPEYKKGYQRNFDYPQNGAKNLKDLTYYFVHQNALFITVQTFNRDGMQIHNNLSKQQLNWFRTVLEENHKSVDHIIVQGHAPVLPVDGGHATGHITLNGNDSSAFWQLMATYNVDLYLCGEHHTTDIQEKNGITQIVHGVWVGKSPISYVNVKISGKEMSYDIKNFKMSKINKFILTLVEGW